MKHNQSLYYAYGEQGHRPVHGGTIPEINVLDEDAPETNETEAEVVLLPFDERDR